jgi:hypothetical protein
LEFRVRHTRHRPNHWRHGPGPAGKVCRQNGWVEGVSEGWSLGLGIGGISRITGTVGPDLRVEGEGGPTGRQWEQGEAGRVRGRAGTKRACGCGKNTAIAGTTDRKDHRDQQR